MKRFLGLYVQVILVMCIFNYCVHGFSIGSKRFRRSLSKRVEKNGFGMFSILNDLSNAYQYTTSIFNNRVSNHAQKDRQGFGGSSSLSGVSGCKKCFLGLQVSQREAYVVSKNSEYFNTVK